MPTGYDDSHVNHHPEGAMNAIMRRREERRVESLDILLRLKQGSIPVGNEYKGTEDIPAMKALLLEAHDEIKVVRAQRQAFALYLAGGVRFVEQAARGEKAPCKSVNVYLKAVEAMLKGISGG